MNKLTTRDYGVVLAVILASGSLYYMTVLQNYWLGLFIVGFLLTVNFRRFAIQPFQVAYFLSALVVVISNPEFKTSTVLVFFTNMLIALALTSIMSIEKFAKAYYNIMSWLAVLSLLSVPVWFFGITSPIKQFENIVEVPYQNFLVFGIRAEFMENVGTFRNAGLFWEPGAFQIFLNLGFMLGIIFKLVTWRTVGIFFVTIVTTNSTAGILVFSVLLLVYLIEVKQVHFATYYKLYFIGLIGGLLAYVFADLIMGLSDFLSLSIEKFQEDSTSYMSYQARRLDYWIDWNMLRDYPLLGVGLGNYPLREQYGVSLLGSYLYWANSPPAADGLFVFVAQVGLIGFILLIPLVFPGYARKSSRLLRGSVGVAMIIMFNNENMLLYLLPFVMIMYGLRQTNMDMPRSTEQKSNAAH